MQTKQFTTGVLTAIGGLLALNLVALHHFHGGHVSTSISVAGAAQPEAYRRDGVPAERPTSHMDPTEGGMVSAAEQRKLMLIELRAMNARLVAIETRLGSGVNVAVTDMPQITWPAQPPAPEATPVEPAPAGNP